jgi:hypothetical protein
MASKTKSTPASDTEAAPGPLADYAAPEDRPPFIAYAATVGAFATVTAGALLAARQTGHELPERMGAADLASIGVASHKVSRLIAKDKVTAPFRAPFTEYEGDGGPGEVSERSRGKGAQRAVGELLTCPYCLGLWVVAAFSIGLLFAPRLTRFAASVFSALTISDFLQIAYKAAEEKGLG